MTEKSAVLIYLAVEAGNHARALLSWKIHKAVD
jgi:hypothetical protein